MTGSITNQETQQVEETQILKDIVSTSPSVAVHPVVLLTFIRFSISVTRLNTEDANQKKLVGL